MTPWEVRERLLGCLCAYLSACGRPVCECTPYHGATPLPADKCDCQCAGGQGQAWVRVVGMQRDLSRTDLVAWDGGCGTKILTAFEAGVYRCVQAIPRENRPPTAAEYTADVMAAEEDMAVLLSLLCCPVFTGFDPENPGEEPDTAVLEDWRWSPMPVRGGCQGQTMTIQVTGVQLGDGVEEEGFGG